MSHHSLISWAIVLQKNCLLFCQGRELAFLGFIFLWSLIDGVENGGRRSDMEHSASPWLQKADQSREAVHVSASEEVVEAKLVGSDSCTELFQGNRCKCICTAVPRAPL